MRRLFLVLICIACVAPVGCAAVFKGGDETVHFTSEPSGADVRVDGMPVGRTPCTAKLKSSQTHIIEWSKDGYRKEARQLGNHVGAGWVILDLFNITFIPLIIDAATGDWHYLNLPDGNQMHGVLEPESGR